jgi:hypothetical protein
MSRATELSLEPLKCFLKEQAVKTWAKALEREQKRSDRSKER